MNNFRITGGKGFGITFANGWSVSVQWGPGNYCDNYGMRIGKDDLRAGEDGSNTAECAIIDQEHNFTNIAALGLEHGVSNRSTPDEVAAIIAWAVSQPPKVAK